jgi:hypothetical protein
VGAQLDGCERPADTSYSRLRKCKVDLISDDSRETKVSVQLRLRGAVKVVSWSPQADCAEAIAGYDQMPRKFTVGESRPRTAHAAVCCRNKVLVKVSW